MTSINRFLAAQQTDDVITTSIACGPEVDDVTTASSFSSVDKQRADDDVIEQLDRFCDSASWRSPQNHIWYLGQL